MHDSPPRVRSRHTGASVNADASTTPATTTVLAEATPPLEDTALEDTGLEDAALAEIAGLLARNPGPATILFEELAGERVRIDLTSRGSRRLTRAEALELHVDPEVRGYFRMGTLRTAGSGLRIADVSSLVLADRLPVSACRTLGLPSPEDPAPPRSAVPLGKVLGDLGVRREPLGARLVHEPIAGVEASARMWLGDVPVALASEFMTAGRAGALLQKRLPGPGLPLFQPIPRQDAPL